MSIVSAITEINTLHGDGRRDVQYRFVDHLGIEHIVARRLVDQSVNAATDIATAQAELEAQLKRDEVKRFIRQFIRGVNPLRDAQNNPINPEHQTRNEAIQGCLDYVLKERDPTVLLKAIDALDNLTDTQIKGLMGFTQAKVDEIRAKALTLKGANTSLTGYVPPIEE